MKGNFETCLTETLRHEGGYVNNRNDPGGETNMGISRRAYPYENIKGMTRARAAQIYRRDYWDKLCCDDLPPGIDLAVFDAGVNSGVLRSAKWLQEILGVQQDGNIGPKTLLAAAAAEAVPKLEALIDRRRTFLRGLAGWKHFGAGWEKRLSSVLRRSRDMAEQRPPSRPSATPIAGGLLSAVLTALAAIQNAILTLFRQKG